jgi:hypothetical protein
VELLRDIVMITHFLGLAMIIGPFLVAFGKRTGFAFSWVLAGGITQLVSGLVLTGLAEMRLADNDDLSLDHTKIAVKLMLSLIIFSVALIGWLGSKKIPQGESERPLLPLLHTAGALAIITLVIAVVWPGVVR